LSPGDAFGEGEKDCPSPICRKREELEEGVKRLVEFIKGRNNKLL
jgi:hypothetical protein